MKVVTRHLPRVAVPTYTTVRELVEAYEARDKFIRDLTVRTVEDAVPSLALMKLLLSRRDPNRHLVIEARKQGVELPWWSDCYVRYQDRLREPFRSMERRIGEYCENPPLPGGMYRDFHAQPCRRSRRW